MSTTVSADNPIFDQSFCYGGINSRVIKLTTREGIEIKKAYNEMIKQYKTNVSKIHKILNLLVKKTKTGYKLHDIDSNALETIIQKTKEQIRLMYIESLMNYQYLLDRAKNIPNVKLSISKNE